MSKIHASGWLVVNVDTGQPIDTDDFSGGGGGGNTIFTQPTPSSVWNIPYTTPVPPVVEFIDSGNSVLFPSVSYNISSNLIIATFGGPTSGIAILS